MQAAQFRAALKRLCRSKVALARELRVNVRTVRRWASGESEVPETVALLIDCWVKEKPSLR